MKFIVSVRPERIMGNTGSLRIHCTVQCDVNMAGCSRFTGLQMKDMKDALIFSFGVELQNLINNSLITGVFPDELKMGEISSLFKSEDSFIKKNYRPITVLPAVSEVYERIMQDQIIPFMEPLMSIYLCGFRKGYSTQHALM